MATANDIHGVPCDFKQTRVSRSNQATVTVAIACDERFDEAVYIGADERGIDEWLTRITAIAAGRGALTLSALAKPPMFTSVSKDLGLLVATAVIPDLKSALDRLQAFAASDIDPIAFRDPYLVGVRGRWRRTVVGFR
jgi:hypothetical protein